MLSRIKVILGITDATRDELLTALIKLCTEEAQTYTHNGIVTESCICDMVVWKYNRLGTEGVDSENYSGVSFNYSADYPESILRQLRAHRRLMTL